MPLVIPLTWKIAGGLGLVLALIVGATGIYFKGRSDGKATVEAAVAAANLKLERKAEALSNELIIQQAIAMGATAKKAGSFVQQIHAAPDDGARVRAANLGVRSLVLGEAGPAGGSPAAAVPGPRAAGGPK